ncbi:hypothetical protein ACO0QE_002450 [Hanseniaspora vineae]
MLDPLQKFKQEFQVFIDSNPQLHHTLQSTAIAEHDKAQIIISPGSLFHKFERSWVSKSYKKTIVERPERLLACSIGISAALTMFPALYTIRSIPPKGISDSDTPEHAKQQNEMHNISKLMSPHVIKVHGKEWPVKLIKYCQESAQHLEQGKVEVPDGWNAGDIYLSPTTLGAIANSITALESGVDTIFGKSTRSDASSMNRSSSHPTSTKLSSSSTAKTSLSLDNHLGERQQQQQQQTQESPSRCFVMVRPPGHHCHIDFPEGFCLMNNVYIAAQYASDHHGVTHVAILDYDLHHGDGTQDLCFKRGLSQNKEIQELEKQREAQDIKQEVIGEEEYFQKDYLIEKYGLKVGYFSMHDINSFPTEVGYSTEDNIAKASTCIMDSQNLNVWNVHMKQWNLQQPQESNESANTTNSNEEDQFYKLYNSKYRQLFSKADEFLYEGKQKMQELGKPFKGLIIVSSGFDASEYETPSMQRHKVNVPTSFYNVFTKDALKLAQLHTEGKILSVLEGGYSDAALVSGMFSHLIGLQNQDWIKEWGSQQLVKELCKGCKHNWKPHKKYSAELRNNSKDIIKFWSQQVIKLGRSMIPEFQTEFFDKCLVNNMGLLNDPKQLEQVLRELPASHTRSKTKQLEQLQGKQQTTVKDHGSAWEKPKPERSRVFREIPPSKQTIMSQKYSDEDNDDEDEDYVYDEELNKTFNRTVEDITIDDISRHLETLEIIEPSTHYSENNNNYFSQSNTYGRRTNKYPTRVTRSSAARRSKPVPNMFLTEEDENNDYSLMDITMMSAHPVRESL